MPNYVVGKVVSALNHACKAVRGSRILVLGLAYKKNVNDVRESPSVIILELLRDLGGVVFYNDPFVPAFPKMREHNLDLSSVALTPDTLASYDCIVLATDHDEFDYEMIAKHAPLVVDTRGRFPIGAANVIFA